MRRVFAQPYLVRLIAGIVMVSFLLVGARPFVVMVRADKLAERSLTLSSSYPDASAVYTVSFTNPSAGTIGSIRVQFCANDPLVGEPCDPPSGFDMTAATLLSQNGMTGFSISPVSTVNELILTRTPASASANLTNSYAIDKVHNPSAAGSYYARIETFASTDASGANTDSGGLAFMIANSFTVSAEVPPHLLFCTGIVVYGYSCTGAQGSYINFGELSFTHTSSGQSQMLAATNAQNGYSIWVSGNTLTSGNNIIPALSVSDIARPGIGQFGINLTANGTPEVGNVPSGAGYGVTTPEYSVPDRYHYISGDMIATSSHADDLRKYTVSYIVDIPNNQPVGVYATTLTYVCLANF